jgi:hypothetical protein
MVAHTNGIEALRGEIGSNAPAADALSLEEAVVIEILTGARDLSHGSEELLEQARCLPHPDLLSPEAANFLQPFEPLLHGNALLIGDAGPLARYLAERGCSVCIFQPNQRAAMLALARCRGVDVKVRIAKPLGTGFDVIVTTDSHGVAEFQVLKDALNPGGILIATAPNRLAARRANSSDTDGVTRASLEGDLRNAGFEHVQFSYVFPSMRAARLIIRTDLAHKVPGIEGMLASFSSVNVGSEQWWRDVIASGLLPHMADSFVALAGLAPLPSPDERELLRLYSSFRRKHFAHVATLRLSDESFALSRAPLFPNAGAPADSYFVRRSYIQPFAAGELYWPSLNALLQSQGCTPDAIACWAKPWIELLTNEATEREFRGYIGGFRRLMLLPPQYVDCIPSNIVVDSNGKLTPFDFEYEALAPIPLSFVVFRGLFHGFSKATRCAFSKDASIIELVRKVMSCCGLKVADGDIDTFIETEASLQNAVAAASSETIREEMRAAVLHTSAAVNGDESRQAAFVELFWKTEDAPYSVERSSNATFIAERAFQTLAFPIAPIEQTVQAIRMDPCDRRGVFYVHAARLRDAGGNALWSWDGNPNTLGVNRKDVSFAELPTGGSGALLYCESEDPNFELAVAQDALSRLRGGGTLEVDMSWPDRADARILSRRLIDTRAQRERISTLEAEALAMKEEIARREEESGALVERAERHAETSTRLEREAQTSTAEVRRVAAANEQLTCEIEGLVERLANLERDRLRVRDRNSELGRNLEEVRSKLNDLSTSTLRAERARDAALALNRELQEQLTTVNDQVKSLSAERDLLRNQSRTIEEMGQRMDQLSIRVDHVEQLIIGLFQGRIWRTLTTLGSPLKAILGKGHE